MLTQLRSGITDGRGTLATVAPIAGTNEAGHGARLRGVSAIGAGLLGRGQGLEALVDDPLLVVLRLRRTLLDALVRLLHLLVDDGDEVVDRHGARHEATV